MSSLSRVSARWLLTQVGTTLASDVSASATTFPVANASGRFAVGEYAVIDSELVRVTGVTATSLTVQRGAVWPAAAHAAGARIAATISHWAGTLMLTRRRLPVVDVGASRRPGPPTTRG
jgi:hypothetical protein